MPIAVLTTQSVTTTICPPDRNRLDLYCHLTKGLVLSIRQSGSRVFYWRYRDGHGTQRQYRIGDAESVSLTKARALAQKLRSKVLLGENPNEDRKALRQVPRLSDFVREKYVPHIHRHRRNFQSTISFLNLHILPKFGSMHLDEITSDMISEAHIDLRNQGYAPAMANKMPIYIGVIYGLAQRQKINGASTNPASSVVLFHANNSRERYLSQEEAQRLHDAVAKSANTQLRSIVGLLLMLGCRKRELLESRWEDFDMDHRSWRIPMSKSGKARHVALSLEAMEILESLPRWEGCPYVIPNPDTKKPFQGMYVSWNTARVRANLPDVRLHDLRHSFASFCLNHGTRSIFEIGRQMGHSQIKSTQRYTHISDSTLLAVVDSAASALGGAWAGAKQSVE